MSTTYEMDPLFDMPIQPAKSERVLIAEELHTISGGEQLWMIARMEAKDCWRCLSMADAIIQIRETLGASPLQWQADDTGTIRDVPTQKGPSE